MNEFWKRGWMFWYPVIIIVITMVLISGCSSYDDCVDDCKKINNLTFGCAINWNNDSCYPEDLPALKEKCFNECKGV